MDRLLSYIVRIVVWLSRYAKPLSHLRLYPYEEYTEGQPLKILLVGYNGARNTGADARVVALTQQLEQALGADNIQLTVMTLDTENVKGYFSQQVRLLHFTTMFLFSLLKACSTHHAALLCEGSTLSPTFADVLCVFYCEAAGIMSRQGKPCMAYGSEVGKLNPWLSKLSSNMCRDTYFMVRTEESLRNLQALGLKGHVGTDTAWTFHSDDGELWAQQQLKEAGWDGTQPLVGVAPLNPFCWPVRPSIYRWIKALFSRDFSQRYDKFYFFSDDTKRHQQLDSYLKAMTAAANRYAKENQAFVVILGMEKLDAKICRQMERDIDVPHAIFTSDTTNVFQMTGLLRQLSMLLTSRYHASVLSMEHACPIVAVSIDARLNGVMREIEQDKHYLHLATDENLENRIMKSLQMAEQNKEEISNTIKHHLTNYKTKTMAMSQFYTSWLKEQFS